MAASLNTVHLLGNLTRDVEQRFTPSGTAVAKLGLAINETFTQNNERKERTVFVDVTVWGKSAENCAKFLRKGSSALIIGRLNLDEWTDKQTGQKRSKLGVVAESVQFLGGKRDGAPAQSASAPSSAPAGSAAASPDPMNDDPPF
jgi:single-strand DNA-binding protein